MTISFPSINSSDNVLFVADIHCKTAWSAALPDVTGDYQFGLEQVKKAALANACKLVILGGDIFDRNFLREAEMITYFQAWVRSLHAGGVDVAAYPGNHDRVISYGGVAAKQFYEVAPEVRCVNNRVFTIGERICYAMGFNDNPAEVAEAMVNMRADVNTVFLHQNIKGVGLPSNNFDEDEVPAHVAEIYVGDIHQQIQGQNKHGAFWAYPGPMFPQEAGEDRCGGLVFAAKAPRHGVASWRRVQFDHRPTLAVDGTSIAPSDVLLVERLVADAVTWAKANAVTPERPLAPLVFVKILSSAREHVATIRKTILEQSGARVIVSYEPPPTKMIAVATKSGGVPKPVELVDTYFDTKLRSADGRYLSLRRAAEARALLRALFTPGSRADSVKGRVLAYRSTIKSHLDSMA